MTSAQAGEVVFTLLEHIVPIGLQICSSWGRKWKVNKYVGFFDSPVSWKHLTYMECTCIGFVGLKTILSLRKFPFSQSGTFSLRLASPRTFLSWRSFWGQTSCSDQGHVCWMVRGCGCRFQLGQIWVQDSCQISNCSDRQGFPTGLQKSCLRWCPGEVGGHPWPHFPPWVQRLVLSCSADSRAGHCVWQGQSCKMSQIWQIYLRKNIGRLG